MFFGLSAFLQWLCIHPDLARAQMSKGVKCECVWGGGILPKISLPAVFFIHGAAFPPCTAWQYFWLIYRHKRSQFIFAMSFFIKKALCVRSITFQGYCIANGLIKSRNCNFCFCTVAWVCCLPRQFFPFFPRMCTKNPLLTAGGGGFNYLKCY